MNININNYEIFFIDYFDGNLDSEAQKELFLFLEQHPELKNEFETFEPTTVIPYKITMPDKNKLKNITINKSNYSNFIIAYLEGDLNEKLTDELFNFINSDSQYQADFKKFQVIKLLPDKKITFKNKKSLKKPTLNIFFNRIIYFSSAAAIFLLGLFTYFYFTTNNNLINKNSSLQQLINSETNNILTDNLYQNNNEKNNNNNSGLIKNKHLNHNINDFKNNDLTDINYTNTLEIKPLTPIQVEANPILKTIEKKTVNENYLTIKQFAVKYFKEKFLNEHDNNYEISALDVIKAAVKGINKITDANIYISGDYDIDGNLNIYALNSDLFSFEKSK
jgi:hypothetical protein